MKVNYLLLLLLFNFLLNPIQGLKCAERTIDHCTKCDTGENSDSCSICEDKYFQFFNNLLCLPCNDSTYGQIACEGNCDGTDYKKTRNVFCENDGCKEGYINIDGICMTCSQASPGCAKYSYEVGVNKEKGNFICNECLNERYFLAGNGACKECNIQFCQK